jgi:hypothetical protein
MCNSVIEYLVGGEDESCIKEDVNFRHSFQETKEGTSHLFCFSYLSVPQVLMKFCVGTFAKT